jgi:hypothetical protein
MVLFRNSGTPVGYISFDAEIHLQFIHRDVISNFDQLATNKHFYNTRTPRSFMLNAGSG